MFGVANCRKPLHGSVCQRCYGEEYYTHCCLSKQRVVGFSLTILFEYSKEALLSMGMLLIAVCVLRVDFMRSEKAGRLGGVTVGFDLFVCDLLLACFGDGLFVPWKMCFITIV